MAKTVAAPVEVGKLLSAIGFNYDNDFTEGEQTALSQRIRELLAAGQPVGAVAAQAVLDCVPTKRKTPRALGGCYEWSRNADGTYNMFDVPVFVKHTRTLGKTLVPDEEGNVEIVEKQIHVDEKWLSRAAEINRTRFSRDNYLAPLHVGHHKSDSNAPYDPEPAGHFLLKYVKEVEYEGQQLPVLYADFIKVPAAIFERIKSGLLPYRSIESLAPKYEEIDSIALLETDTPWFRFPLLTLGKEIQREVYAAHGLTRAFARAGEAWSALCYFAGGEYKEKGEEDDDSETDSDESDDKEVDGLRDDMSDEETETTLGGNTMSKILEALQALAKTNEMILAKLGGAATPPTPATQGAPIAEPNQPVVKPMAASAEIEGRIAAVEATLAAQKAREEVQKKVRKALAELAQYNLGPDAEGKLFTKSMESKDPETLIATYVATVKEHGTQMPTPWMGLGRSVVPPPPPGEKLPDEVKEYSSKGPEVVEKAMKCSQAYDENVRLGLVPRSMSRKDFIRYNISRDFSTLVTG